MQVEHDSATNRLAGLLAEIEQLKSSANHAGLLRLRGEVAQLRQANQSSTDSRAALMRDWPSREDQLRQAVAQNPDKSIPELRLLTERDWLNAAMNARFDSDQDVRQTLANLRRTAVNAFAGINHDARR